MTATNQLDSALTGLEIGKDKLLALYRDGGRRDAPEIAELIDPLLVPIELTDAERVALADFLRHGLTDPRVASETPPFDRPGLRSE